MSTAYTRLILSDGQRGTVNFDGNPYARGAMLYLDGGGSILLRGQKWTTEPELETVEHVREKMKAYSGGKSGRGSGRDEPLRSEQGFFTLDAMHDAEFRRDFPREKKRSLAQRLNEGLSILEREQR